MEMKRIAAGVVTVSALGLGGLGLGAGMALADPPAPNPNPGPGVNIGGPGNPAPPGWATCRLPATVARCRRTGSCSPRSRRGS